ncbi:hypothetical protein GOODEAATRI_001083 [Goodea atripinnis]|uniref:Uncharacterized protein n=1 Tax=Goodea atripinnis TaxID=208336 RepID=A0ABV0PAD4_9TELE
MSHIVIGRCCSHIATSVLLKKAANPAARVLVVLLVPTLFYSLEGLSGIQEELRGSTIQEHRILEHSRMPRHNSDDRGSLVSLTEEQEEREEDSRLHEQVS